MSPRIPSLECCPSLAMCLQWNYCYGKEIAFRLQIATPQHGSGKNLIGSRCTIYHSFAHEHGLHRVSLFSSSYNNSRSVGVASELSTALRGSIIIHVLTQRLVRQSLSSARTLASFISFIISWSPSIHRLFFSYDSFQDSFQIHLA